MEHLLRKCPLCGGEATIEIRSTGYHYGKNAITNRYVVRCTKCLLSSRECESYIWQDNKGRIHEDKNGASEAVDLWNKRVPTEGE